MGAGTGPTTADVNMGTDAPGRRSTMVGTDAPGMRSTMVGTEVPGSYSVQVGTNPLGTRSVMVGTDMQIRDAATEPDDVEMTTTGGRPLLVFPRAGQQVRPQPGCSASSTFFDVPTEIAMPPPPPPPDGPHVPIYTGPTRGPPPAALFMTTGG